MSTIPPSTNWLNNMNTLTCGTCHHEWIQPSPSGRCPKCHSTTTTLVQSRVNALPRV